LHLPNSHPEPDTRPEVVYEKPKVCYTPLAAVFMAEYRLGDVIDDHCIKCRRVTNHSIVSIMDGQAAKVRCRTCYHDHDFRHGQAPPSKKELKKAAEAMESAGSDQ
jgi:hypothetical protein